MNSLSDHNVSSVRLYIGKQHITVSPLARGGVTEF